MLVPMLLNEHGVDVGELAALRVALDAASYDDCRLCGGEACEIGLCLPGSHGGAVAHAFAVCEHCKADDGWLDRIEASFEGEKGLSLFRTRLAELAGF